MTRRRVAITGLGAITPLAHDFPGTWEKLLNGESGVGIIERFDVSNHSVKIAAMVKNFDPLKYFSKPEARHLDTFIQYSMVATMEAVKDSGIDFESEDRSRCGAIMATGIGGIHEIESQHIRMQQKGPKRVTPHFIPMIMPNAVSGHVAIQFKLQGPNFTCSSACASSAHALGIALRVIQWGEADVIISGGAEAATTALGLAGFGNMKALSSTHNEDPQNASRPYDKNRDGFVMGEGAAVLVLEEWEHAKKRGARIYAELTGFGMNDDGHHITAPDEQGRGAIGAMQLALKDAGIAPEEVAYVNGHGTSTPLNDRAECKAIKEVFGEHAYKLSISSSKSMLGHLLGGSAAVEACVTACSIYQQKIHPTANFQEAEEQMDLDFVPGKPKDLEIKNALKNSFGFGGHNACLVFKKA